MTNFQICSYRTQLVLGVQLFGSKIFDSVIKKLIECRFYVLALDPSVDISSISKLILFVRFCNYYFVIIFDNIIKENSLKVIPMKGQIHGVDYFETVSTFLKIIK